MIKNIYCMYIIMRHIGHIGYRSYGLHIIPEVRSPGTEWIEIAHSYNIALQLNASWNLWTISNYVFFFYF